MFEKERQIESLCRVGGTVINCSFYQQEKKKRDNKCPRPPNLTQSELLDFARMIDLNVFFSSRTAKNATVTLIKEKFLSLFIFKCV